jgi:hypothetical protein
MVASCHAELQLWAAISTGRRKTLSERPLLFVSLDTLLNSETPSGFAGQRLDLPHGEGASPLREVRALCGRAIGKVALKSHGRVTG